MDRYRGPRRSPPPRDRDRDRDRDRVFRERDDHPDVEYFGEGESYRPGGSAGDGPYRPPNRERQAADSWGGDRREPRRDDRRDDIDSYIPATSSRASRPRSRSPPFRRRSRTPPNRGREDLFPNRGSPPRRYSPRRSPPPRRRSRSLGQRTRSPQDPKRFRDFSPDPSRRSPKRERRISPERNRFNRARSPPRRGPSPDRDQSRGGTGYRPRSRTPPRRFDRKPQDDSWRRRSPSPRNSAPISNNTSRRSSPPIHPDRTSLTGSGPRSPPQQPAVSYDHADSAGLRDRSPPAHAADHIPKGRESAMSLDQPTPNGEVAQPPSGPSSYRNGTYERPPPTGPSRSFSQSQRSPPTGPASSSPSISGHGRGGALGLAPPTRPRGVPSGPARDFTSPPLRGRGSLTYRGPAPYGSRGGGYARGDYNGGRGDYGGGRGDFGGSPRGDISGGSYRGGYTDRTGGSNASSTLPDASFPFRGNSSSSATYPRTQRFNPVQQHLSTAEKIIPGGKLLPSGLPPEQDKRIKTLEAEAEKMRKEIAEKQRVKREVLNEWEIRERESERETLRSELADAHLQQLVESDDGIGRAAF